MTNEYRETRLLFAAVSLVVSGAIAAPAVAQDERRSDQLTRLNAADPRLRLDPNLQVTERAVLEAGGYLSVTGLNLNDENANSRRLFQYDTTLYARAVIDRAHTAFGRARFRYLDFSPGDSFSGRGDEWAEPFVDRYWYEYDSRVDAAARTGERAESGFNVRAGRQYVDWGSGLVLSENLYAARGTLFFNENLSLDLLGGVTPGDESVIDFDASRDDYNEDTERGFFGGLLRYESDDGPGIYGYALHMPDYNDSTVPSLPLGVPVQFDYEATYFGIGANGAIGDDWLWACEFVYETGTSMSDPLRNAVAGRQTEEDVSAYAGRLAATHLLRDERLSQIQAEVLFGSGDSDRLVATDTVGGNRTGTDDTGFNSLGFTNTGLVLSPGLSNIVSIRGGYSTFPLRDDETFRDMQFGVDAFLFGKLNEDAPIDEPTLGKRFLGPEIDLSLNYRLTSDLAFTTRYGVYFPGPAIAGESDVRQFILVSFTLSF